MTDEETKQTEEEKSEEEKPPVPEKKRISPVIVLIVLIVVLIPIILWARLKIVNDTALITDLFMEGGRQPAPEFKLTDLDGNPVNLDQFRGKVVMLDFWESWCEWCVKEMPSLAGLYERYKDSGLVVLSVNVSEPKEIASGFGAKLPYPVVRDVNRETARRYEVDKYPAHFIIDRQGRMVNGLILGAKDWMSKESHWLMKRLELEKK